ncbi:phage protein, HK97 gp10 family [Maledivibacter halophilus]|uniref:Phage protein, HK97 gp10 family n=2 Tax=Maledivibacter halophilus TaxID=36842 RepID=A0A1T5K2F0_9FIRM|nr:phage protein, HK97 gp10 family [Maledivibacter halophilus]
MADMKVEGMENLLAEIEKLGQKGSRIENKALREAGDVVKESIKKEVPVRTGKLKQSITASRVKTKDGVKRVEVGPDKDGYYGKFVEFGTVKMKANPFMSRGYETSKEEAMEAIEKNLKEGLGL